MVLSHSLVKSSMGRTDAITFCSWNSGSPKNGFLGSWNDTEGVRVPLSSTDASTECSSMYTRRGTTFRPFQIVVLTVAPIVFGPNSVG